MTKEKQVFLLIGLTKESEHWDDDFIAGIERAFETKNIVKIDLPGSGVRLSEKSPLSIEEIVKSTRSYYSDQFTPDVDRILISISMGGMVGSKWCHLFPDDFTHFVIMNSSFKNFSGLTKRVQPKAMLEFLKIFATRDHKLREKRIISLCSNREEKHEKILNKWVSLASDRSMTQENMARQTFAAAKYKMDFKLNQKVLVIVALHDRLAHHSCSLKLNEFWNKDLHIIDNKKVGHAIHIDASEEVPEIIKDWYLKHAV